MEEITLCKEIKPKKITKCEHNKIKTICKECRGGSICNHNKIRSSCKDCRGGSICIHNKHKSICKDCKGSSICKHNKMKQYCKECKGSSICQHNKIKNTCKECKGSSICQHNRMKSKCKECGGSSICEHDRIKSVCKECGGGSICEHQKQKSHCKECGGNSICEHNRMKQHCKECGGASICEHNRIKSTCKECGGTSICQHGKSKFKCKVCKGTSICQHGKEKPYCSECGGSALCINCKLVRKSKKYDNHCLRCFIYLFPDKPAIRNYKTKETATSKFVTENFPNFTWNIDKKIEDGCSRKRPDLMCDLGYQVLIVEVDENQHDTYDCSCENKRIMQISQDIGHRPLIFIRFNPDDYLNCSGNNVSSCWTTTAKTGIIKIKNNKIDEWNTRLNLLKETIEYWTNEENKTEKTVETIQLFYDQNM